MESQPLKLPAKCEPFITAKSYLEMVLTFPNDQMISNNITRNLAFSNKNFFTHFPSNVAGLHLLNNISHDYVTN